MPRLNARLVTVSLAALVAGCAADKDYFDAACPAPGKSLAAKLTADKPLLTGPNVVTGKGDYMLRSRNATFVITATEGIQKTYYHYGGILADAAPASDCRQTAPDQFEELGLLFGKLNLADFQASTLRAFRGEKVEIVNDGSDGKAAHVRVTGVDDFYWLVEYELIKRTFLSGGVKPPSQPYGVKVTIDYILDPGAAVLQVVFNLDNQSGETQRFMVGSELLVGDDLRAVAYGKTTVSFGGFTLLADIPFLTFGSPSGSYAFGLQNARMSQANISGVNAVLNLDQALTKPLEARAGERASMTMFFTPGASDPHSAARNLQPYLPAPVPGWGLENRPFKGRVVDELTGSPVSGATVDVQLPTDEYWLTAERFVTRADGTFGDELAYFPGANLKYRLIAYGPGRLPAEPVEFKDFPPSLVTLKARTHGEIAYRIADGAGELMPGKISLYRGGTKTDQFFVAGEGTVEVPPGDYEVSVTRGFEYGTYQGLLTVPEGKPAKLAVSLVRWIDTTGYLSADTHIHSAPSADSEVAIPLRVRTAAAEGIEIPVATDHEIIHGLAAGIVETGLGDFVNTVSGEEFTATLPEHLTIFPVEPDGTPRGSPPAWYLHGIDEQFQAAYDRGAKVIFLNHPRYGCGYLCVIGFDRVTATPAMQTPEAIGLPVTSSVWSWRFQGIEIMNGARDPFVRPGDANESGLFDDWQSFLNHGHRINAIGASDEHGLNDLGMPRIYFRAQSEDVKLFQPQELVDAVFSGDILVSTGAFARVSAGGKGMGELVAVPTGDVTLDLHVEGIPEIDVTHLRVYANCDQVGAPVPVTGAAEVVKFDGPLHLHVAQDAQVVVAGFGAQYPPRGLLQFDPTNIPRFVTNAIYVDVNGNGKFDPPGDKSCTYTKD
jgi:hypothetical protein